MKGIFPKMSIPDIINSLAGWNMPVSQEQLIKPTPDFVQTIYCACLQQITNISHQSISEQVQSALAILEDPSPVCPDLRVFSTTCSLTDRQDLCASALAHNLILCHLSIFSRVFCLDLTFFFSTRFAEVARINDFHAADMVYPARERTIDLLLAFIDFVKFTEQWCDPFVNELRGKSAAMLSEREQVNLELEQVQQKIQVLK
jgi:kinetochore protein Nuf2